MLVETGQTDLQRRSKYRNYAHLVTEQDQARSHNLSYNESQLADSRIKFLPELRKEVLKKEISQHRLLNTFSNQQTEAGVRLKVLNAIKDDPHVQLTPSQLRFESSAVLLSRFHA